MSTHQDCYNYTPLESDALIVDGRQLLADRPEIRNWSYEEIHHFQRRRNECRHPDDVEAIVVHETDSMQWTEASMQALQNRGEGVHFAVLRDGTVYQHNDVVQRLGHARPHNGSSIGIELVNQPDPAGSGDPQIESTIWNTEASGDRPYRLPTGEQLRATYHLFEHVVIGGTGSPLSVPLEWPGVIGEYYVAFPIPALRGPNPDPIRGVVAHANFTSKVDGHVPTLYLWLRLSGAGGRLGHTAALERAIHLAGDGRYAPAGSLTDHGLDGRPVIPLEEPPEEEEEEEAAPPADGEPHWWDWEGF
ncbi:peptidoglycan recognition protein family protein [Natronobiforma cellulositropha]|uniref:peptidoglycan recognition protein family protein n=1 Tax=Natronobiforma cellulositropha TaxID=1679076 RepID=UPI0021D5ADB8|nr:peptidoglycan recognition family protein [Natronobiforma cellulositropha]